MKEVIDRIMRIDGMTAREEIEQLYTLAKEARHGIAEIGIWRGRSTVALAMGSLAGNKVPIYAIDPHEDFHAVAETSEYQFSSLDRAHWMTNILSAGVGNDHGIARLVRLINLPSHHVYLPYKLDLLFIDGDHTHVWQDFDHFAALVQPGGSVLLHENNETQTQAVIERALTSGKYERCADVALTARLLRVDPVKPVGDVLTTYTIPILEGAEAS